MQKGKQGRYSPAGTHWFHSGLPSETCQTEAWIHPKCVGKKQSFWSFLGLVSFGRQTAQLLRTAIMEQETAVSDLAVIDFLPNILEERDWKAGTHGWAYRRLWAVSPTFHHSTLQNSASLPTMGLNFSKQFLKQSVCRLLQEQRWEKGTLTMPLSVICADPWTSGSSRPRLSNNLGTWMKKPTSQINMIVLYPHVT